MEVTFCTREFERDYYWNTDCASPSLSENARQVFAPAFEGSLTTSRFVALFRCPNSSGSVILCLSVATARKDFIGTPIRTLAVLCAETSEETDLLARFFAECLCKPDKETLYNARSGVANAVESLYRTKKLDEFLAFCKSLKPGDGKECFPKNYRCANPRGQMPARKWLADALPAAIAGYSPFLFALTDRLPTDVLASLGSMFDRGTVKIFSEVTKEPKGLPEPASQKHHRAAAIGGAVLLVLIVAAIGTCSRGGRKGEAKPPTDETGGGTGMSTNRKDFVEMHAPATTNSPTQETTVTNAPSTSQDGSGGSVTPATTYAPLQEAAVTNDLPSSSQKGLGGPVTSAVTNTLQQKEAVTNSLKTASDGTGKRKTENE